MENKMYDDVLHQCLERAKENLMLDGYLIPYLTALSGPVEKPTFVPLPITAESNSEKAAFSRYVRQCLKETDSWGYVVVADGWILLKDDLPANELLPSYQKSSQNSNRRESLFIALETKDYYSSVALPYERQGNKFSFLKEITYPPDVSAIGYYSNVLKESK